MTNTNLLKSKMIVLGDENFVQCLADVLNCSRTTASYKLNEKIPFTQDEISMIAKKYQLTADEIKCIFFDEPS